MHYDKGQWRKCDKRPCRQPIPDSYPYRSTFELGVRSLNLQHEITSKPVGYVETYLLLRSYLIVARNFTGDLASALEHLCKGLRLASILLLFRTSLSSRTHQRR